MNIFYSFLEVDLQPNVKIEFQLNFILCSWLKMRWSFRSEGPNPTKTHFKHVDSNIEMAWLNIPILKYGPPEIFEYIFMDRPRLGNSR